MWGEEEGGVKQTDVVTSSDINHKTSWIFSNLKTKRTVEKIFFLNQHVVFKMSLKLSGGCQLNCTFLAGSGGVLCIVWCFRLCQKYDSGVECRDRTKTLFYSTFMDDSHGGARADDAGFEKPR